MCKYLTTTFSNEWFFISIRLRSFFLFFHKSFVSYEQGMSIQLHITHKCTQPNFFFFLLVIFYTFLFTLLKCLMTKKNMK